MKRKLVVGLMVALTFVGLSWMQEAQAVAEQELIVSAAASLTNAFQEVGQKFASANPGTKVVPNFAASGALLQQIEKGAPVDVFASADQKTMDQANEKKLILPETRKNFVEQRPGAHSSRRVENPDQEPAGSRGKGGDQGGPGKS